MLIRNVSKLAQGVTLRRYTILSFDAYLAYAKLAKQEPSCRALTLHGVTERRRGL